MRFIGLVIFVFFVAVSAQAHAEQKAVSPVLIENGAQKRQGFFLFGPRGTGKTTWLKAKFPQALFLDLLEADTFRSYSARPERLREWIAGYPNRKVIVIDEIQRIPQLLPEIHSLIEQKKVCSLYLRDRAAVN